MGCKHLHQPPHEIEARIFFALKTPESTVFTLTENFSAISAQEQALKQAIRNQRKENWGVFTFVVKEILAPVVGVIGAFMGLL